MLSLKLKRLFVLSNSRGFTLVELMVVVAIIGILASIAIPNFNKYQANARKSEAKLGLASIYTTLQAFQTEHGSYTACLKQAGYELPATTKRYFNTGFTNGTAAIPGGAGGASAALCGPSASIPCINYLGGIPAAGQQSSPCGVDGLPSTLYVSTPAAAYYVANAGVGGTVSQQDSIRTGVTQQEFLVGASGRVEKNAVAHLTINQEKALNDNATVSGGQQQQPSP